MFDIGFWEMVLIFGIGLVVLGPERLPRVATQLGNWAGQARRMARVLAMQIRQEMDAADPRRPAPAQPAAASEPGAFSRPGMEDLKPGASEAPVETGPAPAGDEATAEPPPTGDTPASRDTA
jgi:sec-independent protein translocase protein TatB